MSPSRARLLYALLLAAAMAGVALWRWDLVLEAFRATAAQIGRGGAARRHVLSEVGLFSGIIGLTAWLVPSRVRRGHDVAAVCAAAAVGIAAEAWGTRAGLWRYYTGETPPLWIVPAWPVGALLVERAAFLAEERWGGFSQELARTAYWVLAGACAVVFLFFARPWIALPGTVAILMLMLASLLVAVEARRDLWALAAGLGLVFFADLWGTTNNCWAYAWQGPGLSGASLGILFGMCFDAALVLGCLKLARRAEARS